MKKVFIFLLMFAIFLTSCSDDDSQTPIDNGLTQDINDLVPQSILDEMEGLGFPINGGTNPPLIEGSFLMSPVILLATNVPNDSAGFFADAEIEFSNQNNENLTATFNLINAGSAGEGLGGFIVGDGCVFSIFIEVTSIDPNDHVSKSVQAYSGCIDDDGISDLRVAFFMIDDNGDPFNTLIENGQGRVFKDGNDFSEKLESRPSLKGKLTQNSSKLNLFSSLTK